MREPPIAARRGASEASVKTLWRIELFGPLCAELITRKAENEAEAAEDSGVIITHFRSQKVASLLGYLAYHLHTAHLRQDLVDLFWPDVGSSTGHTSLRQALALLRHQLEPPGVPTGSVLIADRASAGLNPEAVTVDVHEFEAALQLAWEADSGAERAGLLARAVDLQRGPLLPWCNDAWVVPERSWLAGRYFQSLSQLIAHLEQAGDLDRALEYAHRGVALDPLREDSHAVLMRLYVAGGQPQAALRQFQQLERFLKTELGLAPDAAVRDLAREIEHAAMLQPLLLSEVQSANELPPGPAVSTLLSDEEKHLVTALCVQAHRSRGLPAGEDREPEAERVNRFLEIAAETLLRHGGRVEHWLADGVLAVFGALQVREDDAESAMRAALELRQAAHGLGLEVSAAAHTGEAHVGAADSGAVRLVGPVLQQAERLREQAGPGELLVSDSTRRLTQRIFRFIPRPLGTGSDALSGFPSSVDVFAVERLPSRVHAFAGIEGRPTTLIGREEELAQLRKVLDSLRDGRGQIVSLTGEAGVGKSRLVGELRSGVREDRPERLNALTPERLPRWLEGRCCALRMSSSYSLFIDLLHDCFAWPHGDGEGRLVARIACTLQELVASGALSSERAAEVGALVGRLLSLFFGKEWEERWKDAPPDQLRHRTFLAVRDFFVALAQGRPLVLVCEDLHWADPLSLDLLTLLMESLADAPLLLLCVYRPEPEHRSRHLATIAAQKCPGCFTELSLSDLTPQQSHALIESLTEGAPLPDEVKERILQEAGGNPFFTEELVRSLIDAGLADRHGPGFRGHGKSSRRVLTGPAEAAAGGAVSPRAAGRRQPRKRFEPVAIPETVQSVILSRVDRLGPELKGVLQTAAVIGRLFSRRLLEAVIPKRVNLERALWELEERALVYEEHVVPEEEYSFKHVLTQETIYHGLLQRQRAVLHQQVAEAMERLYQEHPDEHLEALAYHYERSGADEKAVEYLLKAGGKSRRAYLNEAAAGYLRRALERVEDCPSQERLDAWRLAALNGLGQIHTGTGKLEEAEVCFRQAIDLARDLPPRDLVYLYWWLAGVLFWRDRLDEAIRIGEEGLALLSPETNSIEAALMIDRLAWCYRGKEDQAKWEELNARSASLLEHLPYCEELRPAYINQFEMQYEAGNAREAEKWLHSLERRSRPRHDLAALGEVRAWEGTLDVHRGDLHTAIPRLEQSLELLAKVGDAKLQTWSLTKLGEALLSVGDLPRAREYLEQGLEKARAIGNHWRTAWAAETLGTVALCEGDCEQAIALFKEADRQGRESGFPRVMPVVNLARAYLARGQRHDALQILPASVDLAQNHRCPLANALSALEAAYDDPAEFASFCRRFRAEHPALSASPFVHWCLEPATPDFGFWVLDFGLPIKSKAPGDRTTLLDSTRNPKAPRAPKTQNPNGWSWHDPMRDCSFTLKNGLVIRAANGRDLWELNASAPRLLRSVSGDFAAETVCGPVSTEQIADRRPAIGGLLLWQDAGNFLRLDRGSRGPDEITFQGRLGGQDLIIGRGALRCGSSTDSTEAGVSAETPAGQSTRAPAEDLGGGLVLLRMERRGALVGALCSSDGEHWFTVGTAAFPSESPAAVGLFAVGRIDRTVYQGAHPDGTAIRFASFGLWCSVPGG